MFVIPLYLCYNRNRQEKAYGYKQSKVMGYFIFESFRKTDLEGKLINNGEKNFRWFYEQPV